MIGLETIDIKLGIRKIFALIHISGDMVDRGNVLAKL